MLLGGGTQKEPGYRHRRALIDTPDEFGMPHHPQGRSLLVLAIVVPCMVVIGWTFFPCWNPVLAVLSARKDFRYTDPEAATTQDMQRQIQQYLRKFDVRIALDDVVVRNPPKEGDARTSFWIMKKNCIQGNLMVWIPLYLNVPVVGQVVSEWCWIIR